MMLDATVASVHAQLWCGADLPLSCVLKKVVRNYVAVRPCRCNDVFITFDMNLL